MPRTLSTTRTLSPRRYKTRNQKNYLKLDGGLSAFGRIPTFEPSGSAGQTLSVFIWVNTGQYAPTSRGMISKFDFGVNKRSWAMTVPNGQLQVLLSSNGSGVQKRYQTNKYLNDGNWHAVGFIWNNGVLTLNIDLDYDISVTKIADLAMTNLFQTNVDVMVGSLLANNNPVNQWAGDIGTHVISNQALTQVDWLNFVYDGASPAGLQLEALVQTGSGATSFDTSGNGRNATLGAGVTWGSDGPFNTRPLSATRTLTT